MLIEANIASFFHAVAGNRMSKAQLVEFLDAPESEALKLLIEKRVHTTGLVRAGIAAVGEAVGW